MELQQLREKIDEIDLKIIESLNERYKLVKKIGDWKKNNDIPIFIPEREQQLLKNLLAKNLGPLPPETLVAIYREIFSGARRLERDLCVASLGPEGTFSDQAAHRQFGHGANYLMVNSIPDVFREVESGRADYGCVPVENSTEGVVNPTLDSLRESNVRVLAELYLPIHHQLLSLSPMTEINCIYSHPQVLGQCRKFISGSLPNVTLIEVASTVRAAELAAREPGAAALAGTAAAERYKLPIVAENVEDCSGNTTRFLIIGKQLTKPTGNDKTSLCFVLKDRAGALYDALEPLRDAQISMSMIESRPLPNSRWEYGFFVDVLGHADDPKVAEAFAKLEERCAFFKVFGGYPRMTPNAMPSQLTV